MLHKNFFCFSLICYISSILIYIVHYIKSKLYISSGLAKSCKSTRAFREMDLLPPPTSSLEISEHHQAQQITILQLQCAFFFQKSSTQRNTTGAHLKKDEMMAPKMPVLMFYQSIIHYINKKTKQNKTKQNKQTIKNLRGFGKMK